MGSVYICTRIFLKLVNLSELYTQMGYGLTCFFSFTDNTTA